MRKRLLILTTILVITSGIFTANATDNKTFILTDGKTDIVYNVSIENSYVTVSSSGTVLGKTYIQRVLTCTVYDDMITFYTVDNLNEVVGVFRFEFLIDTINSEAINANAYYNKNCFTADENGAIYFVDGDNTNKLCVYENGAVSKTNLKSHIQQLLCVDGENVIVVTNDDTYIYTKGETEKIYDFPLSVPAYYAGGGLIKDLNGREYIFENENSETTESLATITETATPKVYTHSDTYYAETGTTVNQIKKAFADFEITKIAKADGSITESGQVGTGATITLSNNESVTVIISGELTGEGNINSRDVKAILNHLSEKELLEGAFLTAADINLDGKIDTKDALMISQMI